MYDIEIVCHHGLRELCEPSQVIEIELSLCPFDGFFDVIPESGHDIEFEHLRNVVIVVSLDALDFPLSNDFEAFFRIGSVSNDIPEADDCVCAFGIDFIEHGVKGFQVSVYVADECDSCHGFDLWGLDIPAGEGVHREDGICVLKEQRDVLADPGRFFVGFVD